MSRSVPSFALVGIGALLGPAGVSAPAYGQGVPSFNWMTQFGSSASDVVGGIGPYSVILAGSTQGTIGSSSSGGWDAFIAMHHWTGTQLWARQFGSPGDDFALAIDSHWSGGGGGVFIAGYTTGDIAGHIGGMDAFVARYDHAGDPVWLRQFGTAQDDMARALVSDGAGGFFIAGETAGSFGGPGAGGSDAFLARYDSAGNQLWIRQFGGGDNEVAMALARHHFDDSIFVAGNVQAGAGSNVFLARYDGNGNELWYREFGSSGMDRANALDYALGYGGVYIGGATTGDLGGPNQGSTDAWLARYTEAGDRDWIRQFGTSEADEIHSLSGYGFEVIAAGSTEGSLFAPNAGASDAFLALIGSFGTISSGTQFGTSQADGAVAVVYGAVVGYTDGALAGSSFGSRDVFLASMGAPGCYPNCDDSNPPPPLNVDDFTCFMNEFSLAQALPHEWQVIHYTNCDGSTIAPVLNVDDFTCFINAFAAGCP